MMLSLEEWMNLRAFAPLRTAGASWSEIAAEAGVDWRTAKKYLSVDVPPAPPSVVGRAHPPKVVEAWAPVIDAMLRKEPRIQATVVHRRLVEEHGFTHSYQRVKLYVAEARERICPRPVEVHRRFEVLAGSQAQVDWGDEGTIRAPDGPVHVYSFHMTLSYSRDPFCCFVTSMDLASFWDCHIRAFDHFGGVPASIVYDRAKTVVRRHVGRGTEVPLHPEAVAFAAHYSFAIIVAPPRRPQFKGRVERQVRTVRDNVLAGRDFTSPAEMDAAFGAWLPSRRAQVHRTHGEVIAVRAALDRDGLLPRPASDYRVRERHLRSVGKDCLVSFETSLYSVPWRAVRRRMKVEVRASRTEVEIWTTGAQPGLLASHARSAVRKAWVVDPAHWDGLPCAPGAADLSPCEHDQLVAPVRDEVELMASRSAKAAVPVGRRDLATYDLVGASR